MLPNRRNAPVTVNTNHPTFLDAEFSDRYPTLTAFLMDEKYSDGTKRLTGSLSVFSKGGSLIVCVNDNDRLRNAYVSMTTWEETMFKIELGIAKDDLEWRNKTFQPSQQKPPF